MFLKTIFVTSKKLMMTKNKISKIEKLQASKGDMKGEIDLVWNPIEGAASYVIQVNGRSQWKHADIVTKSRCTITGLRSNHLYKFRAAPLSGSLQAEWSNIAEEKAS